MAAALVVVVPGAALAADRLLVDEQDVAASLPAGTLALAGTNPTCTVVRENVEYHCVLEKAPAPEVDGLEGHRGAVRGRHQPHQRRLPLAELGRHRLRSTRGSGGRRRADIGTRDCWASSRSGPGVG